jgi:hypothetical protein
MMIKIINPLVLGIVILLSSCSTENPTNPNPTSTNCIGPQPKFQFKANGVMFVCDALFDSRMGWYGNYYQQIREGGGQIPGIYALNGQYELSGGIETAPLNSLTNINLQIVSPSITIGSFSASNVIVGCTFAEFPTTGSWKSNGHTVVLSRVSNGTADGTFFASLTSTVGNTTVTITEGQFYNIPVLSM